MAACRSGYLATHMLVILDLGICTRYRRVGTLVSAILKSLQSFSGQYIVIRQRATLVNIVVVHQFLADRT